MSFSACKNNEKIYSFRMPDDEWESIKKDKAHGLKLPCCGGSAVCKENRRGIRFFDHLPKESCVKEADTSLNYLSIKHSMVDVLTKRGWKIETEKREDKWTADIYAENNKSKLCIQIRLAEPPTLQHIERQEKIFEKANIKSLWFIEFDDNKLRANIGEYNNKANVLAIMRKQGAIRVGGFFGIEDDKQVKSLSSVKQLELTEFLEAFFVQKRIQRYKLDPNKLHINFEYHQHNCPNCQLKINFAIYANAAFVLENEPIQFSKVWYENIEEKSILNYINTYAKEADLGFKVVVIEEWENDEDDFVGVPVQCCTYCGSGFKLKQFLQGFGNNKHSPYRENCRIIYTELGVRFGAIWIIRNQHSE